MRDGGGNAADVTAACVTSPIPFSLSVITMRAFPSFTVLLTFAITGCAGDASTSSLAPSNATLQAAGAAVQRPWEGRCAVDATITGPTTFVITGTCQLAHLGRTTVVTEETMDWALGTFANTSTYTAANGDRLYTTGSGVATFGANGAGTLTGTWTAVGGTGRLAGASGTADYAESVQVTGPATAVGAYTLAGALVY